MDSAMLASPSTKASQQPQANIDQSAKPMDDDDEEL
jgi:hypothetical protein